MIKNFMNNIVELNKNEIAIVTGGMLPRNRNYKILERFLNIIELATSIAALGIFLKMLYFPTNNQPKSESENKEQKTT
jgi:hypothetical protein